LEKSASMTAPMIWTMVPWLLMVDEVTSGKFEVSGKIC